MKPWEFKAQQAEFRSGSTPPLLTETKTGSTKSHLARWAAALLAGREHVYVEVHWLDDISHLYEFVAEPGRLAELRQQAQAKGLYGTVWSCVTNERIKLDSWPGQETLEDEVQA